MRECYQRGDYAQFTNACTPLAPRIFYKSLIHTFFFSFFCVASYGALRDVILPGWRDTKKKKGKSKGKVSAGSEK
jgi:hypothetical protein